MPVPIHVPDFEALAGELPPPDDGLRMVRSQRSLEIVRASDTGTDDLVDQGAECSIAWRIRDDQRPTAGAIDAS